MSMMLVTPKGQQKLAAIRAAIERAMTRGLAREVRRMRPVAAAAAPDADVEARLLSMGVGADAPQGGGMGLAGVQMGTPEGGRFVREGGQVPLRTAIAEDEVRVWRVSPTQVVAGTGNAQEINARTGFSWYTRHRGLQGPTFPFNHGYLEAVEDGGALWIVVPRPGTGALEPEPGVFARRMVKTMPAFQPYRRAYLRQRAIAFDHLRQDVIQAVREVGRE